MASADFTIADVLAWARTKPADEPYDFYDADVCAIAQFGQETGRKYLIGLGSLSDDGHLSEVLENAVVGEGDDEPGIEWTFGALVARLEKLCPETPFGPSEWTKLDAYLTERVPA